MTPKLKWMLRILIIIDSTTINIFEGVFSKTFGKHFSVMFEKLSQLDSFNDVVMFILARQNAGKWFHNSESSESYSVRCALLLRLNLVTAEGFFNFDLTSWMYLSSVCPTKDKNADSRDFDLSFLTTVVVLFELLTTLVRPSRECSLKRGKVWLYGRPPFWMDWIQPCK